MINAHTRLLKKRTFKKMYIDLHVIVIKVFLNYKLDHINET